MAYKAAAVIGLLDNRNRFADLFNGTWFQGVQVVKPEELEDTSGETHVLVEDKQQELEEVHRYRDVTMKWKQGINLMVLACEIQNKVHYAMVVRIMLYDSLSYMRQIKRLWEVAAQKKNRKCSEEEYLSRLRKEDRLLPVVTLVFYYGIDEWDGSLDLYGLLDLDEGIREDENLMKYLPNYRINLIDAGHLDNIELFQTDLKVLFGMLKCRKNKAQLENYFADNKEYFENLDKETSIAVGAFLNSDKMMKAIEEKKEETIDMCKALEDWLQEREEQGVERGIEQGIEKGIEKGTAIGEERFAKLAEKMFADGRTEEFKRAVEDKGYRRQLFDEYGL